MNKRTSVKIMSFVLAVVLILSSGIPFTTFAAANAQTTRGTIGTNGELISFTQLPPEISLQTLLVGASQNDLILPDTLEATVRQESAPADPSPAEPAVIEGEAEQPLDSSSEVQEVQIHADVELRQNEPGVLDEAPFETTGKLEMINISVPVLEWIPQPEFDSSTIGTYAFTPVLDGGGSLAENTEIPTITVTVQMIMDSAPQSATLQSAMLLTPNVGDTTINAGDSSIASGIGWTYLNGVFTVTGDVTVTGTTTTNHISVPNGATVNIILDGTTINLEVGADRSPIIIGDNADVTLTLAAGTANTLTASQQGAGIRTGSNSKLTINGTGELIAQGAFYWPGIGGNSGNAIINIMDGKITANGGAYGAGIGGSMGYHGNGTITISGGTVVATGGDQSAGIGGGALGDGGIITISGGTVTAASGDVADNAIGPGSYGDTGTITITGGKVDLLVGHINPQPTNGSTPIYLNTLSIGNPNIGDGLAIESITYDSDKSYNNDKIFTADNGMVYIWLPQNSSDSASVDVVVQGVTYTKAWARTGNAETETLLRYGNAETPNISAQPQNGTYTVGSTATPLTVTVSVSGSDNGTLSYQWYQNTNNNTTDGMAIGTNSANYTPDTNTVGTLHYYCVVTNTNTNISGSQTATATSSIATVTVNAPVTTVPTLSMTPNVVTVDINTATNGDVVSSANPTHFSESPAYTIDGPAQLPSGLSLNASTGEITVTSTAALAAASTAVTVKAEYLTESATAMVDLTISGIKTPVIPPHTPTLTTTPTDLNFGNVMVNTITSSSLSVSGTYLTGNITYDVNGDTDAFAVDASAWDVTSGGSLRIVFKPTAVQTYNATITIFSNDASSIMVTLTGNGTSSSIGGGSSDASGDSSNHTQPATAVGNIIVYGVNIPYTIYSSTGALALDLTSANLDEILKLAGNSKTIAVDIGILENLKEIKVSFPPAWFSEHKNITVPVQSGIGGMYLNNSLAQKFSQNMNATVSLKAGSLIFSANQDGKSVTWNTLSAPVMIYMPYTPAKDTNLNAIVLYDKTTGKSVAHSFYQNNKFYGSVVAPGVYDAKVISTSFTDTANHRAKDDIVYAVSHGLISGTTATTFAPDIAITRADFIMMLSKLSSADVSGYKTSSFSDVANDRSAMPHIEWAIQNKIATGFTHNYFSPDNNITREQMALMMVNYSQITGQMLPAFYQAVTFADNGTISVWAAGAVKAIQQAGIIQSKPNNRFNPQGSVTRAEASSIIRRFAESVISGEKGWVQANNSQWQYFGDDYKPTIGWLTTTEGDKYYLDKDGFRVSGKWLQIAGLQYYFYSDGKLASNTTIDGYEVGADGARKEKK